ncbi:MULTISPECIES: succinate dehydrogenase assembly factor 4 [Luteimonas]|uniref:DUF1674 domain-containing protein n=1 Tax=Luteimonas TaxID=83614 RepID=UPI001F2377DA|nr:MULTISPECIES: succinate dehydrogenase assembly factor 4 [Luteimonas]
MASDPDCGLSDMRMATKIERMTNPDIIGEETQTPSTVPAEMPVPALPPAQEIGGRDGLEPTRYGDWEKNGRCIDF